MDTDGDSGLWTALLPIAAVTVCCGMPLLLAAASAGIFVTAAAWLETYRPYLIATALLLAGVAVYAGRRQQADCCAPGEDGRPRHLRRLGVVAWIGAALAAIVAALSVVVPGS